MNILKDLRFEEIVKEMHNPANDVSGILADNRFGEIIKQIYEPSDLESEILKDNKFKEIMQEFYQPVDIQISRGELLKSSISTLAIFLCLAYLAFMYNKGYRLSGKTVSKEYNQLAEKYKQLGGEFSEDGTPASVDDLKTRIEYLEMFGKNQSEGVPLTTEQLKKILDYKKKIGNLSQSNEKGTIEDLLANLDFLEQVINSLNASDKITIGKAKDYLNSKNYNDFTLEEFNEFLNSVERSEGKTKVVGSIRSFIDYYKSIEGKTNEEIQNGGKIYLDDILKSFNISGEKIPIETKTNLTEEQQQKIKEVRNYISMEDNKVEYEPPFLGPTLKQVPSEYFYRESPFERILLEGPNIFHIVTGFPTIKNGEFVYDLKKKDTAPIKGIVLIDLKNISTAPFTPKKKNILNLSISKEEIKQKLDDLMYLTKPEQWSYFKKNYLDKYNSNSKDLAEFTYDLLYYNLNEIVVISGHISGAFAMLEVIFYNKTIDFPQTISYLQQDSESEVSNEFLIDLAQSLNFEKNTIKIMIDAQRDVQEILNDEFNFEKVHNKKTKAFVVKDVYERLEQEVLKDYVSIWGAIERYNEEKMKIYNLLIQKGGTFRNRALYLMALDAWEERDYDFAIQTWKKVDPDHSRVGFQDIRKCIYEIDDRSKMIRAINKILEERDDFDSLWFRYAKYDKWKKRMDYLKQK